MPTFVSCWYPANMHKSIVFILGLITVPPPLSVPRSRPTCMLRGPGSGGPSSRDPRLHAPMSNIPVCTVCLCHREGAHLPRGAVFLASLRVCANALCVHFYGVISRRPPLSPSPAFETCQLLHIGDEKPFVKTNADRKLFLPLETTLPGS